MINAEALMRATVAAASPNTSQPTSMFASTSSANQEASPKNNTLLMPLNSGTKSSNISVQRKIETSLDSLQDFQSNNSGNNGETPVITPRLPELADLARQVYPLIKRLIAMERERVRSF